MTSTLITEPQTKEDYYALLTPKERDLSKDLGQTFYNSSRRSIEAIKEAGDALIKAKKGLKNKFMYFCKYELPLDCSQDTIEGFMRLASIINERPALAKYNPTIIFELSRRSTPVEVVEEMTTLAELDQHQEVRVKEVKEKIATAKNTKVGIKRGDIVEWPMSVKGYTFGRVRSKTIDGIACKIETLNGKYLGEKATKQLILCPIQKVHEGILDTQALQVDNGQKVIISPYESGKQHLAGMTGTVIARYHKRRTFSVQIGENVFDFLWEELLLKKDPSPIPPVVEPDLSLNTLDLVIDVESTVITNAVLPPENHHNVDLKQMGWSQKRQLLKDLLKEMQIGGDSVRSSLESEIDTLVEKTLEELDTINFGQRAREQFLVLLIDKCL